MKHTNAPQVIGSNTLVDFPDEGILRVPAKVDTGADSSSVWASNIHENSGKVSFELFAPGSAFYTGHTIASKKYVVRLITNSFGQAEYRYKVPLKINIEGKTIIARFTLSDRALNTYPMLVGRRTLQGKFIVDVTKKSSAPELKTSKKVLILLNQGGDKFSSFYQKLNHENSGELETEIRKYSDMIFTIQDGVFHIKNSHNNRDLATYNLIYFKTAQKNAEFASIIAAYARRNNVPYIDRAVENLAPDSKVHQLALLGLCGITVPNTIYAANSLLAKLYENIVSTLGLPFILKDSNGRKGRNNYLIKSRKEYQAALAYAEENDIQLLAQKFINNDGYYRVLVLAKQVSLVMYRSVDQQRSHLFERDSDGPARLVQAQKLPGDVIAMCIRAADQLGWQIAGVDILQDKSDGKWYCLEVNNSPQLVSGAFIDEKRAALASFFKRQMDK